MTTPVVTPRSTTAPTADHDGPACECRGLSVELDSSEGPRRILAGVDLQVAKCEFVSVMGRSGTGKTTLLRVLGGLLAPTSGSTVEFHGRPVDGPPEGVVFVFQNYAASLLPWRTVERNVALGLEGKVDKAEMRERIAEALSMVGLANRAKDYPWRLSGGMQQRVQLARALAVRPSALLMDEPFGALDAMTRTQIRHDLEVLWMETGKTVLFITHSLEEAIGLSDRVLVMSPTPGRIVDEIKIELPRPRPSHLGDYPSFNAYAERIHDAFRRFGVIRF